MIPEHPSHYKDPLFLKWINTVLDHRHGNLRRLERYIVKEEEWTTKNLKRLKKMNDNINPRRPDEPIVVLRGLSKDYLLDGNRRINSWVGDEPHPVWIVCPVY